ncbi:FAD-dependent oxidoreductase, partial [Clostridium sp.]|uniref:FAD-dependent oxidoreductase n=1 Tax=Clostridium sp. TaxID=1506 RepID=UPI003F3C0C01
IKGLENAKYIDPLSGGNGNSIRYIAASPRDNNMKVTGLDNLFCAGEKSGFFVGHTEAIATGTLAGYNAVKFALQQDLFELPRTLAIGDIIAYANERLNTKGGKGVRHTFSGGEYFDIMISKNLYTTNNDEIEKRVIDSNLKNFFNNDTR